MVERISRFPVKSMQGEDLDGCDLGLDGIPGDRAYALVDLDDGKVASAKNPAKWSSLLLFSATFPDEPGPSGSSGEVRITFPDGAVASSEDPDIDERLSLCLGRRVTLTAAGTPAAAGRSYEATWPDVDGLVPSEFLDQTGIGRSEDGEVVSALGVGLASPPGTFFDVSVLHVLTQATLRGLSTLAPGVDFDARRYRPGVLVGGDLETFAENSWVGRTLSLGADARISVSLPTMRCVMTTLAQSGLDRDRQTLRAVAAHNRVEIAGLGTWACAGAYASVTAPGSLALGDAVVICD